MDGIPAGLPALLQATKASGRAAKAGFEWGRTADIYAKAHEELEEFRAARGEASDAATRPGRPAPLSDEQHAAAELEFGDLLFSMAQLARWNGIDPETALRRATVKFMTRFRHMEAQLQAQSRDPSSLDADGWWALWALAKRAEPSA
jgi:tetrapyrrole methylase family protein/MazG family protein